MEPPLAPPLSVTVGVAAATVASQPPHIPYPDSLDSSPRSRNTDSWGDESLYPSLPGPGTSPKLRLMCSYGGHIVPRPHDKSLCYVGGDTRIVVVDRHTNLSDLTNRLSKTLLNNRPFTLKYQLPNEDLDSLISVTTDEDLENMIDEYDRLHSSSSTTNNNKSSRLRLFLFSSKPESASSIGSLLENSTKSEDWFLNALNGAGGGGGGGGDSGGFSESASVNCLLGLDDEPNLNSSVKAVDGSFGNVKGGNSNGGGGGSKHGGASQDVHSVPDSPMLETTSSFGSASSSPSLANLPPIRVHVEDQKMGIEDQFSQMGVVPNVLCSPPTGLTAVATTAVSGMGMGSAAVVGEYQNRVFSDDERSEQGMPILYRKPPQAMPLQLQQKQTGAAGLDIASPDSVSSDGSITNPLSRQKPMLYQDPIVQIPSGNNRASAGPVDPNMTDPNTRIQMQQLLQDSGYLMPTQLDPQHAPQQQQFIHAGTQYIQHHPSGAVPMASYYPIYPSQQQQRHPQHPGFDQQYPVYYVPSRQPQAYNLSMQQPGYSESATTVPSSRPQTPHPSAAYYPARNAPAPKPEMATAMYRTTTTAGPSLVQVPSGQHQPQYVGFSQIHHPSQSIAPTSAATANYGYEFADPSQTHMYYTQPLAPQLAAQYQTMTSAVPEASAHLHTDNIKQQVRTSQP